MNLQELLEELRENILRDVSDAVSSSAEDFLFSDKSLVRYIDEAHTRFATLSLCLRDETTPEITEVVLAPGQEQYALDPRVVAVLGARMGNRHLSRTTYGAITSPSSSVVVGAAGTTCAVGRPYLFYTDRETSKLGVYPVPTEEEHLRLRVARKPLETLTVNALRAVPEIPSEWHLDMLEWAAYRALRNHDADVENMAKANSHKKRFEDTVLELQRQSKRLLLQDLQFNVDANWR